MFKLHKNLFFPAFIFFLTLSSFNRSNDWPTQFGKAEIDANYCVKIDTEKPLEIFYRLDISHLAFSNETEAQKVFGAISNNLLSYKVDFLNQFAYLKIHSERTKEPKDVVWWNAYIQSLCKN